MASVFGCQEFCYFDDWELPKQDQYELWVMLGLLPVLIDSLLLLQLRWSGGRLKVSKAMEEQATNAQAITTALVSIWEFREWTDSCWLTMGFCSRRMVASTLTCLDNLVTMLRGTKYIS